MTLVGFSIFVRGDGLEQKDHAKILSSVHGSSNLAELQSGPHAAMSPILLSPKSSVHSMEMEASGWLVITPPGRDRPLWLMCSGPTNWMYQKNFLTAA